jgi:hypothetical protein
MGKWLARNFTLEYHGTSVLITYWGVAVVLLIVTLVVLDVLWRVYHKRYRAAIRIAISSTALLTFPIGIEVLDDISLPWKPAVFIAYMLALIAGAIALRTWLIAGAFVGLSVFMFLSQPYPSFGEIPEIVMAVAFGATCGWMAESIREDGI